MSCFGIFINRFQSGRTRFERGRGVDPFVNTLQYALSRLYLWFLFRMRVKHFMIRKSPGYRLGFKL